jgi:hypothetical protein
MLAQLDAGSVVLSSVKRILVTGSAATAATTETKDSVDTLIWDERSVMTREM